MPLLPQSAMSLWAISRPAASTLRIAAWMTELTVQSVTLPAQALERDAVRRAARHRQPMQAHAAAIAERDEALGATVVERLVGAVEDETFEQDVVGVVGGDEGAAAGELQRRGAGGADDARARTQLQRADAVAAGGQLERRPAAGGGVECGLQHRALIDGAAGDEVQARHRHARASALPRDASRLWRRRQPVRRRGRRRARCGGRASSLGTSAEHAW